MGVEWRCKGVWWVIGVSCRGGFIMAGLHGAERYDLQ